MVKKEMFLALMVVSIFLISACDVYNTLYIKQAEEGESVEVSEDDIILDISNADIEGEVDEEVEEEVDDEEEELEEETEVSEDATVMIVEETELISLVPKAEDPDMDTLTFTFTSPLDDNGEWQTTYSDAGEYTVTVTASDGLLTASKEVLVIVNRKEEAPVLNNFNPQEATTEISETESVEFEVSASDLNDDILRYSWKLDGIEIGDDNSAEYQTTYEDSGSHTVKVIVSDGIFEAEKIWSVTVNNVNRKPSLTEVNDVEASETDTVVIELDAQDGDGDHLSYAIDDERFVQDGNVFTWETTYDDEGDHLVTVSVSDGVDTISQEITITIGNVNRAPIILDIVQK